MRLKSIAIIAIIIIIIAIMAIIITIIIIIILFQKIKHRFSVLICSILKRKFYTLNKLLKEDHKLSFELSQILC